MSSYTQSWLLLEMGQAVPRPVPSCSSAVSGGLGLCIFPPISALVTAFALPTPLE